MNKWIIKNQNKGDWYYFLKEKSIDLMAEQVNPERPIHKYGQVDIHTYLHMYKASWHFQWHLLLYIGGRCTNRCNHFVSNLVVPVLLEWAELSFRDSSHRFILLPLMSVQRYLWYYLFDNSFSGEHLACFVFFFYKKSCYHTLKCSQKYFLWEKKVYWYSTRWKDC